MSPPPPWLQSGKGAAAKGGRSKKAAGGRKGGKKGEEEAEEDEGDFPGGGGDGDDGAGALGLDGDGEGGAAGEEGAPFDWGALRETAIDALIGAIGMDLRPIWPMGSPDEEWLAAICKTGPRMLASAEAMKNKGARRATVEVRA